MKKIIISLLTALLLFGISTPIRANETEGMLEDVEEQNEYGNFELEYEYFETPIKESGNILETEGTYQNEYYEDSINVVDENNSVRGIIGGDDRNKVVNTKIKPYSSAAYIKIKYRDGWYSHCTGTMVKDNYVLTAAHCLAKDESVNNLGNPIGFEVSPGFDKGYVPFGTAYSVSYYFPKNYYTDSYNYDIGMIKLDRQIGLKSGIIDMSTNITSNIKNFGYPGDKSGAMFQDSGDKIHSQTTNVLRHTLDTKGGSSGSGIFNSNNEIVAVHVSFSGPYNNAVKINEEKLRFIYEWR